MIELKKLLAVLREKRVRGCEGNGDCGPGHVCLVGTGPGDPEILTLKVVKGYSKCRSFALPQACLYWSWLLLTLDFLMFKLSQELQRRRGLAVELGIPLTHQGVATSV